MFKFKCISFVGTVLLLLGYLGGIWDQFCGYGFVVAWVSWGDFGPVLWVRVSLRVSVTCALTAPTDLLHLIQSILDKSGSTIAEGYQQNVRNHAAIGSEVRTQHIPRWRR